MSFEDIAIKILTAIKYVNQGLHCRPHCPAFGDLSAGAHPEQPDDGVRDCSHHLPHNQLVGQPFFI